MKATHTLAGSRFDSPAQIAHTDTLLWRSFSLMFEKKTESDSDRHFCFRDEDEGTIFLNYNNKNDRETQTSKHRNLKDYSTKPQQTLKLSDY